MPNWCGGVVTVEGKFENVKEFCKLFLFEEDVDRDDLDKKYFARSFIHSTWESFEEEFFKDYQPNEDVEIQFCVDFAWSAWSCLIDGYPTKDNADKKLITLEDACKIHKVKVDITTEEPGMGFEEEITSDENGVKHTEKKMREYECECGETQLVANDYDFNEVECYQCGKVGKYKYDLLKHT
jgi:hypothetical protein